MRILYSTTLLADDANLAVGRVPAGLTWNGEPVIDVFNFFRDALATVYGRADGPEVFAFNLVADFASEAQAVFFCATHRASLPLQADLLLTDAAASYAVRMAGAVRSVQIVRRIGLAVTVQYRFTGRQFTSEDAPETDPEDIDMVKKGSASPASGAETVAIVFGTPFGATPTWVNLFLVPPGGQPPVIVSSYSVITSAGFTAILAAALPASGYSAVWKAEL